VNGSRRVAAGNRTAVNGSSVREDEIVEDAAIISSSGRVPWAVAGSGRGSASAESSDAPPTLVRGPVVARAVLAQVQTTIRLDTGEVLAPGFFALLGREPAMGDGDPPAEMIRFDDPKLSVSKTHLALGIDDQGLWVMDRNSTNGTTVIEVSGERITCTPGDRRRVRAGSIVQFGQRRFTVEESDAAATTVS
jgi:hypothetical protein